MTRFLLLTFLSATLSVNAFTVPTSSSSSTKTRTMTTFTTPVLKMSTASMDGGSGSSDNWYAEKEEPSVFLMRKAEECANSDSCSVEAAQFYLGEVIHVQNDCAQPGSAASIPICETPIMQQVNDIISMLRLKAGVAATAESSETVAEMASEVGFTADSSSSPLSSASSAMRGVFQPHYLMLALSIVLGFATIFSLAVNPLHPGEAVVGQDVLPFTAEEWRWALQGGYLPTMVSHFLRHGGL